MEERVIEDSRWRGYAMVVGACVCWGVMATVAKLLFRDRGVDPLFLVVVRSYLAALTLFAVFAIVHPAGLRIGRRGCWAAAVVGAGGLMSNNFFYFQAIHLTSVATALLLQYQAPILVALYTLLVQRQRLSGRLLLSLALVVVGCALVIRVYDPAVLRPNLLGVAAGLATACAFAFYLLASRAALRTMGPWTLLTYAYLCASLAWAVVIPPWQIFAHRFDAGTWWAFLAVATIGTVMPFGLLINGLKFLPPTQVSIISTLEPVVAAVAAYVILGETLLPLQILGGGLVLAGVVVVETTGRRIPA